MELYFNWELRKLEYSVTDIKEEVEDPEFKFGGKTLFINSH